MRARQPVTGTLPRVWLLSDERNDGALERTLAQLPRGSGFVFRHYHLAPAARRRRFAHLLRAARRRGHWVMLGGSPRLAQAWGADGSYGPPLAHPGARISSGRLATAHDGREIAAANRSRALAVMISPVFPTRSHPGASCLGRVRLLLLARHTRLPVIALGGMTAQRARALPVHGWAAIDGLSHGDS